FAHRIVQGIFSDGGPQARDLRARELRSPDRLGGASARVVATKFLQGGILVAKNPDQPGGGAPFVRAIVSDPNSVPDVMLLYGYVGASSEAEHERLYLRIDLSNYVEIPKSAILHRAAAPTEQDPHGGVTLWVKQDAKLVYKMAPGAQALAHYFAGQIQAAAVI